jgi:hypothetical protein
MGRGRPESDHQYNLELREEITAQNEDIWRQLLDGDAENITKLDQKYHRLVTALLESKSTPIKEILNPSEIDAAEESLRLHDDFAGQNGEVRLEKVPKLIFHEDVKSLTDEEVRVITEFKGLVLMNYVEQISKEQAELLVNLKAPLFIKGLLPEKGAAIITDSGYSEATLPTEINEILAKRKYYTGVANRVLTAFQIAHSNFIWNGHTVDAAKPE